MDHIMNNYQFSPANHKISTNSDMNLLHGNLNCITSAFA